MNAKQIFQGLVSSVTLTFRDKNIESDYIDYYNRKTIAHVRVAIIISLGLYIIFAFLDSFLFPDFKVVFHQIRFFIVTPFILLIFLFTFHSSFFKYVQVIISLSIIVGAAGIMAMLYIGGERVIAIYYVGLLLVLLFNYEFLKLRFLIASIVGFLIVICYFIVALQINISLPLIVASLFFLVGANILGMASSYSYEFLYRQYYYSHRLLEKEKAKTVEINLNLEAQVSERTSSLKKTNNELLEAKLIAENSERTKSIFLATMSHELRTPLNAIIGFSDIINSEKFDEKDNKEYAQIINRSGVHLLGLVENLFDITLIDSGQVKLNIREFNLFGILDDVFRIMYQEKIVLEKNDVELKLLNDNLPSNFMIYSDGNKIKQVLINLLKNALKFTETGEVKFWCEEIVENNKPYLKFFVQDTGIGIPPVKIEFVFDVFRQVDDTYSRKYGGVGIGLTVVRKLVNMLGGEVGVDSVEGKGSTFYFTIGNFIKKEMPPVQDEDNKRIENFKPIDANILIVEDDEASYYLLEFILEKRGAKVIWAKNGEIALEMMQEYKKFDLILMDINMPILSGYDTSLRIKELYPDQIIIAQTAYAVAGDKEKALEAGCDAYITKPISAEKLNAILDEFVLAK